MSVRVTTGDPRRHVHPNAAAVRAALPTLYEALLTRAPSEHGRAAIPELCEAFRRVAAALRLCLASDDVHALEKVRAAMQHVDEGLPAALVRGGWERGLGGNHGRPFPAWAALVLFVFTMPKLPSQAVSVGDLVNGTLRDAWAPMATGYDDAVPVDDEATDYAMFTLVGGELGGYVRLLYEAAREGLVPAAAIFGDSDRPLYRHFAGGCREWAASSTVLWTEFACLARTPLGALAMRDATVAGAAQERAEWAAGLAATSDATAVSAALGAETGGPAARSSTIVTVANPPGADGRRPVTHMTCIAGVHGSPASSAAHGDVLHVPGLVLHCTGTRCSEPTRGSTERRDVAARVVGSISGDLLSAFDGGVGGGGGDAGAAGDGAAPPSGPPLGGGGCGGDAAADADGDAPAPSTTAQARRMAAVARAAGFATAMRAYFEAATGRATVARGAGPAAGRVSGPAVEGSDTRRTAMARVAVAAGFGRSMLAYLRAAEGLDADDGRPPAVAAATGVAPPPAAP